MSKLVSIVLPTYNGSKYIKQSIESVINQTYENWELIVVNDCSTDDTLSIVKEYAQRDSRIKVITNETNLKLPTSLNVGFSFAQGDYYTWTSDDNLFKKNAIEIMVLKLNSNSEYALVSANCDFINENDTKTGELSDWYKVRTVEQLYEFNNIMACFMYRKEIALEIGEYDTNTFGAEDYDYWCRIALKGKLLYIEDNLYEYRFHNQSLTSTQFDLALDRALYVKTKYFYPLLKQQGCKDYKIIKIALRMYDATKNIEYKKIAKRINILLYFYKICSRFLFSKKEINYRKVITILGIKIKFKKDIQAEKLDVLNLQLDTLQKEANINKMRALDLLNNIFVKIKNQNEYMQTLLSAKNLHQQVFPKYKNINRGKDVVLVATGPSLADFQLIENAIYVGVNKAFKFDKIKCDYLFLQDYSGATKSYIEDFCKYDAKKFLGFIPDNIQGAVSCIIPEKYSNYPNVERYYVAHPTEKENFTFDIATQPFGDAYSIAFPAMQFILWTNPKRIFLVGCDCSLEGYHDSKEKNNLAAQEVIEGWKRMKEFSNTYYPDTEIISINPVGLKGVFKDICQNNEGIINEGNVTENTIC